MEQMDLMQFCLTACSDFVKITAVVACMDDDQLRGRIDHQLNRLKTCINLAQWYYGNKEEI